MLQSRLLIPLYPLFLLILLLFSFGFGFDITDEAVHYHFLQLGPQVHYNHVAFVLFHYLGELWDQRVIPYRDLSLVLVASAAVHLGWALHRVVLRRSNLSWLEVAAFELVTAVGFFAIFPVSPHYNTFVYFFFAHSMACYLNARGASSLFGQAGWLSLSLLLAMGTGCAKPPSGVLNLLLIGSLALWDRRRLSRVAMVTALVVLPLAALGTWFAFDWPTTFRLAQVMAKSSHDLNHLMLSYWAELWHFALRQWLPVMVGLGGLLWWWRQSRFVSRAWLIWWGAWAFWLSPLVSSSPSPQAWSRNAAALVTALVALAYWNRREWNPRLWKAIGLVLMIALGCAFGTNNSIASWVGVSCLGLTTLLIAGIESVLPLNPWTRHILVASLVTLELVAMGVTQFQRPYRRAPWFEDTETFSGEGPLRGLRLDPDLMQLFNHVQDEMARRHFDHRRDAVFAAYEIPGVLNALDAQAVGQARYQNGFFNAQKLNCQILEIEWKKPEGPIFLILTSPLDPELRACLGRYVDLTDVQWDREPELTHFFHRRDQETLGVKIFGPLVVRDL